MLIQLMSGLSRDLANRIAEIAAACVNGRSHRRAVVPESAAPRQENFSELTQQKIGASGTGSTRSSEFFCQMTGVDRRAVIEQRRSAVLGVNGCFHQEQTLAKNPGMTGSRDFPAICGLPARFRYVHVCLMNCITLQWQIP
jgi:hypothetical protein